MSRVSRMSRVSWVSIVSWVGGLSRVSWVSRVRLKVLRWPRDENFRTLHRVIDEIIAPKEATKFGMVAAPRLNQNRANVERPAKSVECEVVVELN